MANYLNQQLLETKELSEFYLRSAMIVWSEHCKTYGWTYQEPDKHLSSQDAEGNIILNNTNGFVAKYSVLQNRILFAGIV